jgi:hypothetical protein
LGGLKDEIGEETIMLVSIEMQCTNCEEIIEGIPEDFNDYECDECKIKNTNIALIEALKSAVKRGIIDPEELMEEENDKGWILIGKTTEKEKRMFIRGALFGATHSLFEIADAFDLMNEWEKIVSIILVKQNEELK